MTRATLELDDITYVLEYQFQPYQPETRWDPASGGIEVDDFYCLLPGCGAEQVRIDLNEKCEGLLYYGACLEEARANERARGELIEEFSGIPELEEK